MAIIRQYHKDTDTTYVYESESYWVPELGQSRSKRRCLGKIDPDTGEIVPCGKRGPKKQKPETSQADRQAYQKLQFAKDRWFWGKKCRHCSSFTSGG